MKPLLVPKSLQLARGKPPLEVDRMSSSSNSRFKDMKFKEKLKTSGRPKKSSKQVRFNRTAIDAQRDMANKEGKTEVQEGGEVQISEFTAKTLRI